ncbi:MAG: PLP-dependent aminotransferase family protein [Clostridia bacterium]|nr:PLP-dependent aminotransferase family protein [Clostridia bacterium]
MLAYDLSKRGGKPIYKYLYECIRADIIEERLKPDEKLPGKRTLAKTLGISTNSVMNAYSMLLTEGFIYSAEKRGYYVEKLNFKMKAGTEPPTGYVEPELDEDEFFADFKANRPSLRLFPFTVWGRYMREALSISGDFLYRTVPYKGLYDLRKALADYLYRNRGMEVNPGQIIIGAGTEYLYGRLLQVLGAGRTFAISDPGYRKFEKIAASYKVPWKYISVDGSTISVKELEKSGAHVVHVSPANLFPVGMAMPMKRRIELFEWANREKGRYIIEDDYDSEFRYGPLQMQPLYAESVRDNVIYMNTFSKTLMPSLRISYMVLPAKIMKKYEDSMSFYSCTVSSFEQYALARFISEGHFERHVYRLVNYYRKLRPVVMRAIKSSPMADFSRIEEYDAGTHFLLWVKTGLTEQEIRDRALQKGLQLSFFSDYMSDRSRTIGAIREVPREGSGYGAGETCLVINYAGLTEENVEETLSRLASVFTEE